MERVQTIAGTSCRSPLATMRSASSGKGPLQSKSVSRRLGRKPEVNLAGVSQDDRHGLRMDRRDDRVGFRRQESEKLVLAVDRRALGPADASPGRPEAGEGEERAILAEREPDRGLAGLGVRVFAEGRCRHDAATPLP